MTPSPRALRALVNPAGGLRYHLRALRHRRTLWSAFGRALGCWLDDWHPTVGALLLVGPSGGYCLPETWLGRFATIDALEPDGLARVLFTRRFPSLRTRLRWRDGEYLAPVDGEFSPARLDALVADFPDHVLLFCNVLGQLACLHPAAADAPSFARWKAHLPRAVAGRSWATFHDRLSGPLAPHLPAPGEAALADPTDDDLVRSIYPTFPPREVELETHMTGDLFPGHLRRFFSWEITPGWFHLIEAIRGDPR